MKNAYTPASDMNASAERTMANWFNFFILQKRMAAIDCVKRTPFGSIKAPQMEHNLYVSMATELEGAKA